MLAYCLVGLFVTVLVSGCQCTGVVPMDHDTYMIAKKDGSPGLGVSLKNKAAVFREANDFCHTKGLEVEAVDVKVRSARPAMLGYTELHFRCVLAGAGTPPPQTPGK